MNVNVKLSLTDEQRNTMYRNITGKDVKRMVSRVEVSEFVQGCIDACLHAEPEQPRTERRSIGDGYYDQTVPVRQSSLLVIDAADEERLAGKSASYIRGWNQIKRRKQHANR